MVGWLPISLSILKEMDVYRMWPILTSVFRVVILGVFILNAHTWGLNSVSIFQHCLRQASTNFLILLYHL